MYPRILIPLDGSKTAEKVLPCVRRIARVSKSSVELLGVVEMTEIVTQTPADDLSYAGVLVEEATQNSAEYFDHLAKTFSGCSVKFTVERGRPEEVIIDKATADKKTLIAMATHGRSGVSRWLLGSVTEKILRAVGNPLLLVHAPEGAKTEGEASLKSVAVPLDGSRLAETVLPEVAALVKALDLKVVLVRAYSLPVATYSGEDFYVPHYQELKEQLRKEASGYLETKANDLRAAGITKVECVAVEGTGADVIIDLARQTPDNLVAMCSHGRSGLKRWVLGSVAEKVVRHCEDPVLVMRGE
ncbi:MAG: hypothetical protein GEU77_02575 [Deltaproteobacteria bacterium]|nr:hypothetical protein [Deltaproteobacteria bacterium]